ncbi:MAG: protein kinase [Deltaproteobacteria bacterium]|nr:protein kinase [Deltaproteobacteria bacterium]
MGAVYKADQPAMGRFVGIKILHSKFSGRADLVSRFRREARAMSHLSHPNTARVFLYGTLEDGAGYIVMEYLEGQNLGQVVRQQGPMDPERAVNILTQVCGALEEAHRAGIVHRDLKPENVFLTTQGGIPDFPKVLDFGLAKVTEREMRPGSVMLTQEGMVFGTPEFMSPEQAQGKKLDGRSDIYSLAVILFELLTGKLPFSAKQPMEYLTLHINQKPLTLMDRAPTRQFPEGLQAVLDKALAKKPDDRYQSAAEFSAALRASLAPRPVSMSPASSGVHAMGQQSGAYGVPQQGFGASGPHPLNPQYAQYTPQHDPTGAQAAAAHAMALAQTGPQQPMAYGSPQQPMAYGNPQQSGYGQQPYAQPQQQPPQYGQPGAPPTVGNPQNQPYAVGQAAATQGAFGPQPQHTPVGGYPQSGVVTHQPPQQSGVVTPQPGAAHGAHPSAGAPGGPAVRTGPHAAQQLPGAGPVPGAAPTPARQRAAAPDAKKKSSGGAGRKIIYAILVLIGLSALVVIVYLTILIIPRLRRRNAPRTAPTTALVSPMSDGGAFGLARGMADAAAGLVVPVARAEALPIGLAPPEPPIEQAERDAAPGATTPREGRDAGGGRPSDRPAVPESGGPRRAPQCPSSVARTVNFAMRACASEIDAVEGAYYTQVTVDAAGRFVRMTYPGGLPQNAAFHRCVTGRLVSQRAPEVIGTGCSGRIRM